MSFVARGVAQPERAPAVHAVLFLEYQAFTSEAMVKVKPMSGTKGWLALIFAVLLYAVPVALGAGVACTTVPKLITMAKIEGWLPGARRVVVRIAARWHSEFGRDTGYYEPRVTIALTFARTNDRQRDWRRS
jgi:hypothetical protein